MRLHYLVHCLMHESNIYCFLGVRWWWWWLLLFQEEPISALMWKCPLSNLLHHTKDKFADFSTRFVLLQCQRYVDERCELFLSCFLSYTQVYPFCQQKSAAWPTMSTFYNSGDVVLPCEIMVIEISPPLWQKGMPRPPFSYFAHHVSCKKKGNARSELMASWFARMLWKILLDFLLEHHCTSFKK